jgi:glutathione S-transferase
MEADERIPDNKLCWNLPLYLTAAAVNHLVFKNTRETERKIMKLLGTVGSPYARKVRIVAEEKLIPHDIITASPSDPNSGVQAANPLGKIPVLVCDDGSSLYDSSVIVEYFDGVGAGEKLIPEVFADRIQVKRWEALSDGIADATVEIVHDQRMPASEQRGEALYTKQKKKIDNGLAMMEKDLGSRQFCHGNSFTLADIACGVALGYIDHALPQFNWRKTHPNLSQLAVRLAERETFDNTKHVPV